VRPARKCRIDFFGFNYLSRGWGMERVCGGGNLGLDSRFSVNPERVVSLRGLRGEGGTCVGVGWEGDFNILEVELPLQSSPYICII
jgi:hypothetical protein